MDLLGHKFCWSSYEAARKEDARKKTGGCFTPGQVKWAKNIELMKRKDAKFTNHKENPPPRGQRTFGTVPKARMGRARN